MRQRQQADKDIRTGQKSVQFLRAGVAGDTVDGFASPAPAGDPKPEARKGSGAVGAELSEAACQLGKPALLVSHQWCCQLATGEPDCELLAETKDRVVPPVGDLLQLELRVARVL